MNTGGEVMIYIREGIVSRQLTNHLNAKSIEGIFIEINLRKKNWLMVGCCNNIVINTNNFLDILGPSLVKSG